MWDDVSAGGGRREGVLEMRQWMECWRGVKEGVLERGSGWKKCWRGAVDGVCWRWAVDGVLESGSGGSVGEEAV